MATKQDLYDAIDILSAVYFNGKNKHNLVKQTRYYWLKDKKRKFLTYPSAILIKAAKAIINGSTISGVQPNKKFVRVDYYRECNAIIMSEANKLIKFPYSSEAKEGLLRWAGIAKIAGLLLTVDKINERLAEYGDD